VEAAPPLSSPNPALAQRITVPSRPTSPSILPSSVLGLGDRILHVTYNTAIFAGLVALGVVFLSYAIGLKVGRSKVAEPVMIPLPTSEESKQVGESAPPVSGKVWAIKLMEWSGNSAQERLTAEKNAESIKKSLSQAGHPAAWYELSPKGARQVLTLYYGKFDQRSDDAKEKLSSLRKFKFQNKSIFSSADFNEVDP
jgi:hypothetical protein